MTLRPSYSFRDQFLDILGDDVAVLRVNLRKRAELFAVFEDLVQLRIVKLVKIFKRRKDVERINSILVTEQAHLIANGLAPPVNIGAQQWN